MPSLNCLPHTQVILHLASARHLQLDCLSAHCTLLIQNPDTEMSPCKERRHAPSPPCSIVTQYTLPWKTNGPRTRSLLCVRRRHRTHCRSDASQTKNMLKLGINCTLPTPTSNAERQQFYGLAGLLTKWKAQCVRQHRSCI